MATTRQVVIANYDLDPNGPEANAMRAAGAELTFVSGRAEDDIIAKCADAWAIYGYGSFTRRVFAALPKLRYVQNLSVGFDWIDTAAATDHGVAVANNPRFCREEVADHAAMLILAALRRLPKQQRRLAVEGWNTRSAYDEMGDTPRVSRATLGFIAYGAIARLTADKMRGFGMKYLAYDPYMDPEAIRRHGTEPVATLGDLCARCDVVSMHALLNDETRGMLREEHFRRMKPTAWVVNTSRGATIHEASLIRALREGWIGGACLDVVEKEPAAPDNPLLTMHNVLLTAHSAGYSNDSQVDQRSHAADEVVRVLGGEWPQALVNPAVKAKGGIW